LWNGCAGTYAKTVVRNWNYLNWKYQCHPLAEYIFFVASDVRGIRGILVVREYKDTARIVDYLGCSDDRRVQSTLVKAFMRHNRNKQSLSCTTSSVDLGKVLLDLGFFRARTQPRFFVRSGLKGDSECELGWFLMGG